MNKSEQINELAKALSLAQSQMLCAHKESTNPFFKSKYADLESVWDAIRIPFANNGLAVVQGLKIIDEGEGVAVVTTLMHQSGQWIESVLPTFAVKKDPQGIGLSISYARRYALAAIAGVVQVDDDAEHHRVPEKSVQRVVAEAQHEPKYLSPIDSRINQINDTFGPERLSDDPGEYSSTMGKYKGHKLKTLPEDQLQKYCDWLKEQVTVSGKPLSAPALTFIEMVDKFLKK